MEEKRSVELVFQRTTELLKQKGAQLDEILKMLEPLRDMHACLSELVQGRGLATACQEEKPEGHCPPAFNYDLRTTNH